MAFINEDVYCGLTHFRAVKPSYSHLHFFLKQHAETMFDQNT